MGYTGWQVYTSLAGQPRIFFCGWEIQSLAKINTKSCDNALYSAVQSDLTARNYHMTFGGKDAMVTRSCIQSASVRSVCDQHGYKLKKEQEEAIRKFISGKDVFVCLPTGYGKSVCFMFLPEIMDVVHSRISRTSIVLVVTPLTSLMKDQVDACISHGVKAVAVSSETE